MSRHKILKTESRTNYDAFIARLYKFGSFISSNNHIWLKLKADNNITILHILFLHSDTFSLLSVKFNGKKLSIPVTECSGLYNSIIMLSKYIGMTIYSGYTWLRIKN